MYRGIGEDVIVFETNLQEENMLQAAQMENTSSISSRALLVSVTISQWTAAKRDKAETEAVEAKHGAIRSAARVNKSLLPGAKALTDIHRMSGEIRTFVYKSTLPWGEGTQILRTEGYMGFSVKLGDMIASWNKQVLGLVSEYSQLIEDAKLSLGTLFDSNDYPDEDSIRAKFGIEVKFMPVPEASDWRVSVGEEELDELRRNVEQQVRKSQNAAMREAWDRLFDVVRHAHERLSKPDAVFRDSLIENAVELCDLLPSLNLADDTRLEQMRREIKDSLCKHAPATLRRDTGVRAQAADEMRAAMSKMSAFYPSS